MKRGAFFFIALISAIATIISLNIVFGRTGYYSERYSYYSLYHHCNERYNRDNDKNSKQNSSRTDSTNSNY
jgi:hypothetical protein